MSSCRVCGSAATVAVELYDVRPDGGVLARPDHTCPFLCARHVAENEAGAKVRVQTAGVDPDELGRPLAAAEFLGIEYEERPTPDRRAGGVMVYPFTNKNQAKGFTVYRPLTK